MLELFINKMLQGVLIFVSALFWMAAQVQEGVQTSLDPFQEAAKYGFAVLFLFIVLFLLWKDWQNEKDKREKDNQNNKDEIRDLNKLITTMVENNRRSIDASTEAIRGSTEAIKEQSKLNQELLTVLGQLSDKNHR